MDIKGLKEFLEKRKLLLEKKLESKKKPHFYEVNASILIKCCPHTRFFSCELGQPIFLQKIMTTI